MRNMGDLSAAELRKAVRRIIEVSSETLQKEFDVEVTEEAFRAGIARGMGELADSGLLSPLRLVDDDEPAPPPAPARVIGLSRFPGYPAPSIPAVTIDTGVMLIQRVTLCGDRIKVDPPDSEPGSKWVLMGTKYVNDDIFVEWRELKYMEPIQ